MDSTIIHTFPEDFCDGILKLLNNENKIIIQYKDDVVENDLNLSVQKNQPTDADGWNLNESTDVVSIILNKVDEWVKNIDTYSFVVQRLDETKHSIPHVDFLDYTLVLLLNNTFDGGELIIENIPSQLKKGSLIIFEGKKMHYVSKITKGERFTLVGFLSIKKKIKKTLL